MFHSEHFSNKADGIITGRLDIDLVKVPKQVLYDALFFGPQGCQPGNMSRQDKITLADAIRRGVLNERVGKDMLASLETQWRRHQAGNGGHFYPPTLNLVLHDIGHDRRLQFVGLISDEVLSHGLRHRFDTRLRRYSVFEWDFEGKTASPRGTLFLHRQTFERKLAGRNTVGARWVSPRWGYNVTGDPGAREWRRGIETRKMALEKLLSEFDDQQRRK